VSIGNVKIKNKKRSCKVLKDTPLHCKDPEAERKMMRLIDKAKKDGDSLGGISEVVAKNVPPGLGSYVHYDRRLDGIIAKNMFSIPSVKAVEIGNAFKNSLKMESKVHDEIFYSAKKGFYRKTNSAGGLEAGISNGEEIIVRLGVKPIPTLNKPLQSVNIKTKQKENAQKERSDVCVLPACGVIGESMLAFCITKVFLTKFGGDNLADIKSNYIFYMERIKNA